MLRTLLALILGLYLFIVGLVTYMAINAQNQRAASARNTAVLCALRDNSHRELARRVKVVATDERFLHDNPNGVVLGNTHFSRADLVAALRDDTALLKNQRRVVTALDLNKCP